jgi:hypothetical protein
MISQAQMSCMHVGTPVSYGGWKKVFFVRVVTERDDGTPYKQPHVVMRDSNGEEKMVFQSLFCQHASVIVQMYDVVGNSIELDSRVATNVAGYPDALCICKVVGFTEQKVKLEYQGDRFLKFPVQVVAVLLK